MLRDAPDGPLRGVPVTLKDMFALPWRAARNGTPFELIPAQASGPFRALRDAGAVFVGVANQHELGMGSTGVASAYGRHGNPWNLDHCPGGSSGGSAAAVSARLVAGSLGSDSGGSSRLPAAYCGVVGLKVTYGSLAYDGYFGRGTTFSAPGTLTRDADDARLLTEALLARPLPAADATSFRVGVVDTPFWDDCDPAVVDACMSALDAASWNARPVAISHLELAGAAAIARLAGEVGCPPQEVLDGLAPFTRAIVLNNLLVPGAAVGRADRVRAALRRALARTFEEVDVIAWPTVAAPAPPIDAPFVTLPSGTVPADLANVRQAALANLTGVPGISVPVGLHPGGLPIGLQLLAPWGSEAVLLDAASHLETATGREFVELVPPIASTG